MAVFDRQIYFTEMEWGDESNKKWFKIAQRTTYLMAFITITVFLNIAKQSKVKSVVLPECLGVNSSRSMFLIRHLSKLPMLWVYIPFLACFFSCLFGLKNLSGFFKYQVVYYACGIALFLQLSFKACH